MPDDYKSTPLAWRDKSNTIGFVPGNQAHRRDALKSLHSQLPLQVGATMTVAMASGEQVTKPVNDLCGNQLSRGSLAVRRPADRWSLTPAATRWVHSQNDDDLLDHLQSEVKFFAEMLNEVTDKTSAHDLLGAAQSFGLHWKSLDQIYRRLAWLELLGAVERWSDGRIIRTPRGDAFLLRSRLVSRAEATSIHSNETEARLPEPSEPVAKLLKQLDQETLRKRKTAIGYIPRGRNKREPETVSNPSAPPLEAIRALIGLLGESVTSDEFHAICRDQLNLKKTSSAQTLQTLRQLRVLDLSSFDRYAVTPLAHELLQPGNEVDFVRYLHVRYRAIAELLEGLEEPTSVSQTTASLNARFTDCQFDNGEVRTRFGFLSEAELVERIDWTRYKITARGRAFAVSLALEGSSLPDVAAEAPPTSSREDEAFVESLVQRLIELSHRSDASTDFEAVVAECFRFLGFRSEHLGGSGRTDVLIEAELPTSDSYRSIVDAKSSASGLITDNAIKFDALKEHLIKHQADHGLVVGPNFTDRVREWAANNGFSLITVDDLSALLRLHTSNPVTLTELRSLFTTGSGDLTDLEEHYSAAGRATELLLKVVELLYQEAREEDPLLSGWISLENINYVLRKEMSPRPTKTAVEESLDFLCHELVRGAVRENSRYRIADAPVNISRRLSGLARSIPAEYAAQE